MPVLVPLLEREGAARLHPRGVAIEAPPRERPIRVGEQDKFLVGEACALPSQIREVTRVREGGDPASCVVSTDARMSIWLR